MTKIYASLEDMIRVIRIHPTCSLESFVIHEIANSLDGFFSVDRIAKLSGLKPKRIAYALNKSKMVQKSADLYKLMARMDSIYRDGLVECSSCDINAVTNIDSVTSSIHNHEPLIDACMEFVRQYGDCVSIFEMAILHTIFEGNLAFTAIADRLNYKNVVLIRAIKNLTDQDLLFAHQAEERRFYSLTNKSADIFSMIFKAKNTV